MKPTLETHLSTRVPKAVKSAFIKLARQKELDPAELLREMIVAAVEERIKITPNQPKEIF